MRIVILILTLFPILGQAEVSDFNALIDENSKTQRELQNNIQEKTVSSEKAMQKGSKVVVVEGESYNVPTNGRTLKFKKELHQYRPSSKKELNRLADELKSAEREL